MRIALFSDTYPPQINGVATATYTLANVLKNKGHDVLVVTINEDGIKHLTYENGILRIPGITAKKLYDYKFANIYSLKASLIIKEFRPQVIHVQTEVGIGIFGRLIAKKFKIPLIYTYHTMYEDYTYYVTKGFKPFDRFAKKFVAVVSALISDSTTQFTTTSEKTKDKLISYGVKRYINVIPNGIDFSAFSKDKIDINHLEELRKKYNLQGKKIFLVLGRLAKEKSVDVILTYFKKYVTNNPNNNLHLLIVGDGPNKVDLEELTKKYDLNDLVTFVGGIPHTEVAYFYYLSDLYLSASISETQGLTYNEAMACKLLVFARYDLNLEGTIIDSKTGFFFNDCDSFKDKLEKILNLDNSEREKIVSAAYKLNVEKYSLDLYYERMYDVYNKAIRKFW